MPKDFKKTISSTIRRFISRISIWIREDNEEEVIMNYLNI